MRARMLLEQTHPRTSRAKVTLPSPDARTHGEGSNFLEQDPLKSATSKRVRGRASKKNQTPVLTIGNPLAQCLLARGYLWVARADGFPRVTSDYFFFRGGPRKRVFFFEGRANESLSSTKPAQSNTEGCL